MVNQYQDLNYGLKPFWFWNGEMKDDEIVRQIQEMADKGIGGFFIHPRQGLNIPYLSNSFFEKVAVALDAAKKYGIEMWLYDEYPYPSGMSGGEVILENPSYKAVYLMPKVKDVDGGMDLSMDLPWGRIVHAAAYPVKNGTIEWNDPVDISKYAGIAHREKIFQLSGLTAYNSKRFFTGDLYWRLDWKVPQGRWHVCVFVERTVEKFKYFGTFMDPLNPDAVRCFIRTTHEKYREHFGHEFGKTIKGIFTDETSPMGSIPWSPVLPGEFERRNGYDIVSKLPALTGKMGDNTDKIRYDYWRTVVDLFIESYDMQIHEWCKNNNLLYAGEKPILRSRQLEHMDIPGIDAGHAKAGDKPDIAAERYRANGKIASSAAHFYNKQRTACECYHSIGWSVTHQDLKWIIDWLAVQDIDMFVPHAFFYTTDALAKHDAPPSPFFQMPQWKHAGKLSGYVSNLCSVLNNAKRKVSVLLVDPVTSKWTALGEKSGIERKLANDFHILQKALLQNHIDYYIIDPQLLSTCRVKDGRICVRSEHMETDEYFDVLVIPPSTNLESGALRFIEAYHDAGGKIVAAGCLPIERIDDDYDAKAVIDRIFNTDSSCIYDSYIKKNAEAIENGRIVNGGSIYIDSPDDVPAVISEMMAKDVYAVTDGKENADVLTALYSSEGREFCFFVNTSSKDYRVEIRIRQSAENILGVHAIKIENGKEIKPVNYNVSNGYITIGAYVKRFESGLYMIDFGDCAASEGKNSANGIKDTMRAGCCADLEQENEGGRLRIDTEGQWKIKISGMNALRLDDWKLRVSNLDSDEFRFESESKGTVKSMTIIDQIVYGNIHLPVRLKNHFGTPKEMEFIPLNCQYSSSFAVDIIPDRIWLVMEPGSIGGDWSIRINNYMLSRDVFENINIYMPTNLAVDITPYIAKGINRIEVISKAMHSYDGVVNPLYLFGNFGVYKDERESGLWHIGHMQEYGEIGKLAESGLPFYAGEIIYTREVDISNIRRICRMFIDDPAIQDSVDLHINGYNAGVCSWNPYEWELKDGWLKEGRNTIELRITTGLLGLFEGQYIDPLKHKLSDL